MSTEFTQNISMKIHPKRGILVDKNPKMDKNSWKMSTKVHPLKLSTRLCPFWKKVSTRIHCPREFSITPQRGLMQKALATFYLNTQLLSQVIVLTRKANPGDADLKCHTLPLYIPPRLNLRIFRNLFALLCLVEELFQCPWEAACWEKKTSWIFHDKASPKHGSERLSSNNQRFMKWL